MVKAVFSLQAVHKTMLNVHESGTEAAAVTVIQFMLRSAKIKPSLFITFDRPFLMIGMAKPMGSIIFLGRIMNPAEE